MISQLFVVFVPIAFLRRILSGRRECLRVLLVGFYRDIIFRGA